jgi:hypothetical protein
VAAWWRMLEEELCNARRFAFLNIVARLLEMEE